jgi:2-polyprenyl-3-methyl-5-hydroxy-6-metoxy-1,4-benzoquinol methylase
MDKATIEAELRKLNERFPEKWYHNYHFGEGVKAIPDQGAEDNFLIRSDIIMELIYRFLGIRSREDVAARSYRLLDLGSAEGLQSIEAALHGFDTVGVEGRELFIERAEFAKKVFALENVRFIRGDVRKISKDMLGVFEVTLCLGILYHLDREAMLPFFEALSEMTRHLLVIDTHVDNPASVARYKLGEASDIDRKYFGRMHYEHPKGLSILQKLGRVRASLDNEKSFWFDYPSLCQILADHGFNYVLDVKRPFHNMNADFRQTRVLLVALKMDNRDLLPRCYLSAKSPAHDALV